MPFKVQLTYFRQTGKFLTVASEMIARETLAEIWAEVDDMRRMGRLPSLRPGAGRDLLILVNVPDHPQNVMQLVVPPDMDEDDITPTRIPTGEMVPLVRVPLDEIPRTTTRDIVKVNVDDADDITPLDSPPPAGKP